MHDMKRAGVHGAFVANAVPLARRHIEQWHWTTGPPTWVGSTNLGPIDSPTAAHHGTQTPPAAQTQHSPHPPLFTQSIHWPAPSH
ncbi:hypothetical protein [Sorangium sp. So ce1151]|uniref:hypothetical protein n=1 Tax=Sorangium sp. So ce1151 TaxID=3133332 RepID=UPI003F5E96EF